MQGVTRRSGLRGRVLHTAPAPGSLLHQVARNRGPKAPTCTEPAEGSTVPFCQVTMSRLTRWSSGPHPGPFLSLGCSLNQYRIIF